MNDSNSDAAAHGTPAKLKDVRAGGRSAARAYLDVTYGPMPLWKELAMELATLLLSGVPGALGYFLRGKFYRPFFGAFGRGVAIGRHVSFRHPGKIFLGDGVILDDRSTLDAKGDGNRGIRIGDRVFVGRSSTVYCKGGDVEIGHDASLSANCIVFSSNSVKIGAGTMVGSFSYILSGGEYDPDCGVPYCKQSGMITRGPLEIGENVWIGAHVTVLDAASVGPGAAIGAGSVVTKPIPGGTVAFGTPAKVRRTCAKGVNPVE